MKSCRCSFLLAEIGFGSNYGNLEWSALTPSKEHRKSKAITKTNNTNGTYHVGFVDFVHKCAVTRKETIRDKTFVKVCIASMTYAPAIMLAMATVKYPTYRTTPLILMVSR